MGSDNKKRTLSVFDIETGQKKKSGNASGSKAKASGGASAVSAAKKAPSGTKSTAAASNGRMNTQKKNTGVQENPLARRNSAVPNAAPARKPAAQKNHITVKPANAAKPRSAAAAPVRRPVKPAPKRPAAQRVNGKPVKKRKKSGMSFMGVLMLLLIIGSVGFGVWRTHEYKQIQMMKAVVSNQTFYDGTYIEGVDVSAMTLEDALVYWEGNIEAPRRKTAAVLNDGTTVTAEQMGYTSDYAQVLAGAWNAGRTGSLVERYERITQQSMGVREFSVNRMMYNENVIIDYVNAVGEQVDREPVNAKLKSFNAQARSFEFQAEQPGYTLNRRQMAIDIANALSSGGGNVNMQVDAVAPSITLANVQSQYGMISQAVTNASSSSSNRLTNIKVALSSINGVCLKPGDSFGFNDVVGKRTEARGYKVATAYSGGTVTEEVGGGICQVSTTLFNAAVKADLKIKERHPHSLTVSYVDVGKDAAVDWGNKDLKFTNNSDDNVYIICYLNADKRVVVEIYGKKLANGVTITLEGKKTESVDFETQYELNFNMTPGTSKVVQEGKKGTKAVAYKFWWDANGNEIKREQFCKSSYRSTPQIIQYCP
ncbi:MAG: VanW family protein [Clostridia bacterium]|nr:VanW family protein [Clostridia bacterium]